MHHAVTCRSRARGVACLSRAYSSIVEEQERRLAPSLPRRSPLPWSGGMWSVVGKLVAHALAAANEARAALPEISRNSLVGGGPRPAGGRTRAFRRRSLRRELGRGVGLHPPSRRMSRVDMSRTPPRNPDRGGRGQRVRVSRSTSTWQRADRPDEATSEIRRVLRGECGRPSRMPPPRSPRRPTQSPCTSHGWLPRRG